ESEGFPAFQQIVESMSAGNSGAAEYSYYKYEDSSGQYTRDKKEEKLIAYAPIHLGNEVWAIGVWAPKEDARQLIRSAYLRQLLVVGLSLLTILLGSSYSLAAFYRTSKFLEKEVETKTGELKESHERLLTVLDSLEAAVYVADMETYEILFVNKYLRNLFGDVVGKTCWQALQVGQSGPCDFCTNEKLLVASGEPSTVYGWEFQNTVTGRWYEIRDRAIRWVDGRIVRLEIAIDITERVRAEEELQRNHDAQTVINSLLRLSLEDIPLEELLRRTLDLLLSVPWLAVESKGSIFLVEDEPEILVMKVQKELEEVLQKTCAQISFGRCLCGQAAL
ncbi:MAG: PAS domain-containing protein, partial [Anaerolineae bacterium]|nr:PAS domain-containing protein [Anaerolineae bacterium]